MQSIFYFLVSLLILAYIWLKRRYNLWTSKGLLQGDAEFPFGSYKGIGSKFTTFQIYQKYYERFKGKAKIVGLYSFFTPELLVIDPELIRDILVKNFQNFTFRGMYYNKEGDPMSAK
jgi:cytochrome P450 family 6